jgi:hypothetical protein
MKKMFAMFLSLVLAAAAPLGALGEGIADSFSGFFGQEPLPPFEGLVTEVFEGGFMLDEIQNGTMQVNTDDSTVWDGILSIQPIEVGMYVIVDHNGMMTRSIPVQIYGMRVGCYTLSGVAGEITEEGVLLTGDPIFGDAFVQMNPTMATVFPGVPMLVYYDGVITMSLPGKVNARLVVVPELTGVVSEKDGAGFTLTDEIGNTYRILTSDSLLVGQLAMNEEEPLPGSPEAEALVETGSETPVDEAAIEAVDEPAAEENAETEPDTEEASSDETADPDVLHDVTIGAGEEAAPAAIQWSDGDTVTVYHQGPMEAEPGMDLLALGLLVHR